MHCSQCVAPSHSEETCQTLLPSTKSLGWAAITNTTEGGPEQRQIYVLTVLEAGVQDRGPRKVDVWRKLSLWVTDGCVLTWPFHCTGVERQKSLVTLLFDYLQSHWGVEIQTVNLGGTFNP